MSWTQDQYDAAIRYAFMISSGCHCNAELYDKRRHKRHDEVVEACTGFSRAEVIEFISNREDKTSFDDYFKPISELNQKSSNSDIRDAAIEVVESLLKLGEEMKMSLDT